MKKFLLNFLLFLVPLGIITVYTQLYYNTEKADILRLGYIADIYKDYRKQFEIQMKQPLLFDLVSEVFLKNTKKPKNVYDIFSIGDSFSEQAAVGYQNELVKIGNYNILHFDGHLRTLHPDKLDPIKQLYALIQGGFFDTFKPKMVLLESVERGIGWRTFDSLNVPKPNTLRELNDRQRKCDSIVALNKNDFHYDRFVKFPLINLMHLVHDRALISEVYKVKTDKQYFSCGSNQLLFYEEDLTLRRANNDTLRIRKLNNSLNKIAKALASKGIDFCFVVAPDKYTIYQSRIIGNYPKSPFFSLFDKEKKEYKYIRLDRVLQKQLDNTLDIYFYDDTHWSPLGAKIVGQEIFKQIKK